MVLAAGRGTRMRHLSKARPKPLTVLAGRTLLDRVLDHLETAGVERIVVNTHYMGEMITEHLSGRGNIILSPEEVLLETGGGVRHSRCVWVCIGGLMPCGRARAAAGRARAHGRMRRNTPRRTACHVCGGCRASF